MKHTKLSTSESCSKRMANVPLKGGRAETLLAHALWHEGVRYRKNYKLIPGSPDIAITSYKIAVFVDGEFWHGYEWTLRKEKLQNNRDYWIKKIEENMARDKKVNNELRAANWKVIRFWEKEVLKKPDECKKIILDEIDRERNNP